MQLTKPLAKKNEAIYKSEVTSADLVYKIFCTSSKPKIKFQDSVN